MILKDGILTLTETELCEAAAYVWHRAHLGQRLELVVCIVARDSFNFATAEGIQKGIIHVAAPMSPEARAALLETKPE